MPRPSDLALKSTRNLLVYAPAVPLSHLNLVTSLRNIVKTYKLSPADRGYLVMPLSVHGLHTGIRTGERRLTPFFWACDRFHVHGLMCGLLSPILSGGSVVIPTRFDKGRFWDDFAKEKCNWYTAGQLDDLDFCCSSSFICR